MRFSIINAIRSWQAWKKPRYRRAIRSRHAKRSPKPLLSKSSRKKRQKVQKARRRNAYKDAEQFKLFWYVWVPRSLVGLVYVWVAYEVFMASMLLP